MERFDQDLSGFELLFASVAIAFSFLFIGLHAAQEAEAYHAEQKDQRTSIDRLCTQDMECQFLNVMEH